MLRDQSCWLHKLATLKIDRARGNPAPHKSLLLLAILDMAERGELTGLELPLSPDLAFRFSVYWPVVAGRRKTRPDVRLPFHHLKTSGIWQPLMPEGKASLDKRLTANARLDSAFVDCFRDAHFRDKAKRVLIKTPQYFRPEERIALSAMLRLEPAPTVSNSAHWQLDRSLWSITDDYRVIVSREKFIEEGVPGQKFADFDGHRLLLPNDPRYWPEPTYLAWHRHHHCLGAFTVDSAN